MGDLKIYELITPGLLTVLGFFLLRLLKNFDKVSDKNDALVSDVSVLKERSGAILGLSDKLSLLRDDIKQAESKIAIIQRDMETMWRQIDNLKEQ